MTEIASALPASDMAPQTTVQGVQALTVLVLDDSPAQRNLVCALLRRWGHTAVPFGDPVEALEVAKQPHIDLILCDWMMPGMTGPEFCRRLRSEVTQNYAYVILQTSKTDGAAVTEGLEAGADDFLTKPVRPPELRARMNAGARIVDMQRALVENNRLLETALDELQVLYGAIDRDLDEARRLQQSLLQDRFYSFDGADVSLFLKASGHVGGDMVGCFNINADTIGVYSLDVSGHGVASAMIAARMAGMMSDASIDQNIALSRDPNGRYFDLPPGTAAARMNELLLKEMQTDRYFTLGLGFLDLATGMFRMVQAGHPHPVVLRASGTAELVGEGGMPVGLIPDVEFEASAVILSPGDRLLMYSDGLTECPDASDRMLDEDGLIAIMERHADKTGPDFLERIYDDLVLFAGTDEFPDDLSAMLLEYRGPGSAAQSEISGHKMPIA
ncbi:SpoIIE family protein phosphatase [Gymnodinialimonas sp. 2305UL16-5]|uniref:PP2C family protein-serine/threonine phosphatase n=1 Tax=Gymnodinialimonas mytili TaxID=3126503 RepID=UPI0030AAF61E